MNEGRKEIFQIIVVLISLIFLIKLFFIQVVDNRYAEMANSNAIVTEIEYPNRGLIYDRNGRLLVSNTPEFNLMVVTKEVEHLDTVKFCEVFQLSKGELLQRFVELKQRKEYNPYKPTLFIKQLSGEDFARAQDRLDEFPGFTIQARTTRNYTWPSAANALGYVSEVSKEELGKDKSKIYRQGDYIGKSGIEAYYEKYLSGKRGVKVIMRNVRGIDKGSFENGKFDTLAVPGLDLTTSLDIDLQRYGEYLLNGKAGSIVAIEPSSGEILALVSGPSYDPSLLTGKKYSSNFYRVSADTNKPLFNRPLMAQYRPGSIFKIAQAMTALQEGVITPDTQNSMRPKYYCLSWMHIPMKI